jgi:hypothetical protein
VTAGRGCQHCRPAQRTPLLLLRRQLRMRIVQSYPPCCRDGRACGVHTRVRYSIVRGGMLPPSSHHLLAGQRRTRITVVALATARQQPDQLTAPQQRSTPETGEVEGSSDPTADTDNGSRKRTRAKRRSGSSSSGDVSQRWVWGFQQPQVGFAVKDCRDPLGQQCPRPRTSFCNDV